MMKRRGKKMRKSRNRKHRRQSACGAPSQSVVDDSNDDDDNDVIIDNYDPWHRFTRHRRARRQKLGTEQNKLIAIDDHRVSLSLSGRRLSSSNQFSIHRLPLSFCTCLGSSIENSVSHFCTTRFVSVSLMAKSIQFFFLSFREIVFSASHSG